MGKLKKVTVVLPEDLLRRARQSSGEGITSTIRQGLELLAAGRAYDALRKLRCKVKLDLDIAALRSPSSTDTGSARAPCARRCWAGS